MYRMGAGLLAPIVSQFLVRYLKVKSVPTKREVTSSVLRTAQRPLEGKAADWEGSGSRFFSAREQSPRVRGR